MDIVVVTNPFSETFNFKFDSKQYSLQGHGKLMVTKDVAQHAAFLMAQKQFIDALVADPTAFYAEEAVAARAATFISAVETDKPAPAPKKSEPLPEKEF